MNIFNLKEIMDKENKSIKSSHGYSFDEPFIELDRIEQVAKLMVMFVQSQKVILQ